MVVVTAVAVAGPAHAQAPTRSTTASYNGPDAAVAADSYATVFLTDTPGTLTGFAVTSGKDDRRLRVRVRDNSGQPVAINLAWDRPDGSSASRYYCNAHDVTTPDFPGGTELYIAVVGGVCQEGSASPSISTPTQGTVSFDLAH